MNKPENIDTHFKDSQEAGIYTDFKSIFLVKKINGRWIWEDLYRYDGSELKSDSMEYYFICYKLTTEEEKEFFIENL